MKAKFNYKSKKNIIIIAIAAILLVAAIVGTVAFIKGNQDAAAAMTGDDGISTSADDNGGANGNNAQNSGNEQNNPQEQIPTVGEENDQTATEGGNTDTNENDDNAGNTGANNATANNAGTTTGTTGGTTTGTNANTVPNQEYTQTTTQITEKPWETTVIGWSPITVSAKTLNVGINKAELQKVKLVYVGNASLDAEPVRTVAQKGEELTYIIKVTNSSNIDANNIKIYDSIPEGTQYVEGSISDNGTIENNNLSWKVNIAKGETKTVSFKVTVISEEFSVIDNTAKVDGEDTNEVHTPIITKYKTSELIVKDENGVETIEERDAKVGETIKYKVNVVNSSKYAGTTSIYDIVPEGTTLVDGSISNDGLVESTTDENGIETKKIVWDNVQISANGTTTVSFDVTINEKKINPETLLEENVTFIKNQAVVGNYETNEVEDKVVNIKTVKTSVGTHKDGTLATEENPLHELDKITYTLTSTNYGEGTGSVVITDELPDGTRLLNDDTTVESKIVDSDGNEYTKQELEDGITLTLEPDETKTITFTVIINPFVATDETEEVDEVIIKHITNTVAKQDGTPIPGTDDPVEKEYKEVTVTKIFVDKDNIDELRPEFVLVGLFTDKDTEFTEDNALATTTLKDKETYVFEKLDKYDLESGEEITYTVKEINVDKNYKDSYETTIDKDNADNTKIEITNTLIYENVPTSKTASKIWLDNNNPKRPTSVTLAIYDKTTGYVQTQTATEDENENWEVTFIDLQKYREDGTKIEYTFDEPTVPEGYVKVVDGNQITNKLPEIEVVKTIISVNDDPVDQDEESQENVSVKAGDIVGYKIEVKNTGNVTLNNVTIKDVMENGGRVYFDKELKQQANIIVDYDDELILQVGEDTTYTVYYEITDEDRENVEENPSLTNTVTAEGYFDIPDEDGNPVQNPDPVTSEDTAEVNFEREPDISIVKEQYVNGTKLETNETTIKVQPGQVIDYKIIIKNIGNINLTNIDFTDIMNEDLLGNIREVENIQAKVNDEPRDYTENNGSYRIDGILEVGDVLVITAKYTVVEEFDMSADQENTITNTAIIDTEETTPSESTVNIQTVEWKTIFDINKKGYLKDDTGKYTVDANGQEVKAKDTIKYVLTVENSGKKSGTYTVQDQDIKTLVNNQYVNVSTNVTVNDYKADGTAQTRAISADQDKTIVEKLYDGIDVFVTGESSATVEFEVTVTANVKPGQEIINTVGDSTVVNKVTKDIVVKSNIGKITDANYVLIIDSSSSMYKNTVDDNGTTRLDAAKDAIRDLVKLLFADNAKTKSTISIVQFNADAKTVTVGDQKVFGVKDYKEDKKGNLTGTINTLIDNITATKGTNIQAGLEKAGDLLYNSKTGIHAQNLTKNKKDVVILLSDGTPSYGEKTPEGLGKIARTQLAKKGSGIVNEIYGIAFGSNTSKDTLQQIAPNQVYSSSNKSTLYNAFNKAIYASGGTNAVTLKQVSQVIYTGEKQISSDKNITITYKGLAKAKEYTFTKTGTSSDGALKYEVNKDGTYSLTFNLIDEFVDKEDIVITYYVK